MKKEYPQQLQNKIKKAVLIFKTWTILYLFNLQRFLVLTIRKASFVRQAGRAAAHFFLLSYPVERCFSLVRGLGELSRHLLHQYKVVYEK